MGVSSKSSEQDGRYFRRKKAAQYIQVCQNTFDSYVRRGLIASIRPSVGVVLFRKDDLDNALEYFRVQATGEALSKNGGAK
jgi:hypothetical protein